MRDLAKDMEICNKATPPPWNGEENTGVEPVFETGCGCCTESTLSKEDAEFIAEAREGWPYAIERAIKAEAENAKLRAVVEAARVYVMEHDKIPNLRTLDEWIIIVAAIRNALAELDKEDEMIELNRIYNEDCLEGMKRIPDGFVDLTVTSPPYDNLRTYNGNIEQWSFEKFQGIAKELYRVTKHGGVVVWVVGDATIKGSETGTSFRQALHFMDCGFNLHDTMIYEKNGTGACGSNNCYWQTFEYMFVFTKGKIKTVHRLDNGKPRTKGGIKTGRITKDGIQKVEKRSDAEGKLQLRSNIWRYNVGFTSGDDKTGHPAVFPELLAQDHMLSWSNEGDVVFDPFMGSGTTAKMALLNNRNYIGFELDKRYCEIANERIRKALAELDKEES